MYGAICVSICAATCLDNVFNVKSLAIHSGVSWMPGIQCLLNCYSFDCSRLFIDGITVSWHYQANTIDSGFVLCSLFVTFRATKTDSHGGLSHSINGLSPNSIADFRFHHPFHPTNFCPRHAPEANQHVLQTLRISYHSSW
jgi:hypothetical protein